MRFFYNPWGNALLAAAHTFPGARALSVSEPACTATIIALPEVHFGPTATVFTSTETAVRAVHCGACTAVAMSELPLAVLPAVRFVATVTADAPATVTSFACAGTGEVAPAPTPPVELKGPMRFLVPVPVPVAQGAAGTGKLGTLRGRELEGFSIETVEDEPGLDSDPRDWPGPQPPSGSEPAMPTPIEGTDASDWGLPSADPQGTADAPSGFRTLTHAQATRTTPPNAKSKSPKPPKTKSKGKKKDKNKTKTKHAPHATPSPHSNPTTTTTTHGAWWSAPPAEPHTIFPLGASQPLSCTKSMTLAPALPRSTLTVYPATVTHTSRWDCGGCALVYSTLRLTPTAPVSFVKTKTARKPSVVTELVCTDTPRPPKPTSPEMMGWGLEFGLGPKPRAVEGDDEDEEGMNDTLELVDEAELERLRALGFHIL